MSEPPLVLRGLTVRYRDRTALHEVSLTVTPGEVVALAGPNGSGKSTLLRSAVGLERPVGGDVRVGGSPLHGLSLRSRARAIAWMPQEEPVGDNLRVEEYVRYGRFPHVAMYEGESEADAAAVVRALDLAGAAELGPRRVWELSGGERQRVRLARVLAQATPILLLDEPTAHLDMGHQLDVLERVRLLARRDRVAVVLAVHDLNLAARFADRIVVLHRGRMVADGAAPEVLSPRLLLEVWGVVSELRYDARSHLPYLIPQSLAVGSEPLASAGATAGPRVHLMAGGGSGVELLPRLVDAGYVVSAGALPLFDSDTLAAQELGVATALEVPFAPIGDATRRHLAELLRESRAVVVAPFPVGPTNLSNLEALRTAPAGTEIFLLRQPADRPWDYTGGQATALRAELLQRGAHEVGSVDELLRALERWRGA